MHPELFLAMRRQSERELEQHLAQLRAVRERPGQAVHRAGLGLRPALRRALAPMRGLVPAREPRQVACCSA